MTNLAVFAPLSEISAEKNLQNFVQMCRERILAFGVDLDFDSSIWDITNKVQARAKTTSVRVIFSDWETANQQHVRFMPEPFLGFSKAYVRFQHVQNPIIDQNARLAPLRALCAALQEIDKTSPVHVDGHVLNRAATLLGEKNSEARAYRLGLQLEKLAEFLLTQRMMKIPVAWKSHLRRPADAQRIGKEFDERRNKKLPAPIELEAVAKAYVQAKSPGDVIVSSIAAIMCATPDRIAEILTLRSDCEHDDRLGDGSVVYGLRYWPAKGADPMVKYVIPSMTDLVKGAVSRIRVQTESARKLARWYEENSKTIYLPIGLEEFRGKNLTIEQVSEILFGTDQYVETTRNWLSYKKFSLRAGKVDFQKFETEIIGRLPKGFPYFDRSSDLKFSDALCVVHENLFHQVKPTYVCSLQAIAHGQVSDRLGGRVEYGVPSMFERLGILGDRDEPIRINTHKFRHYLNTLALQGGLNGLDLAKWSGRKDVQQNRMYDHISAHDKLTMIRDAIGEETYMFAPAERKVKTPTISRKEFANLKISNAHTTDFGYCVHDYASTPCQRYVDCLNCNELVCIKGDEVRAANIRLQRDETEMLLNLASQETKEKTYGANRWVEHQTKTLERLNELCQILHDPMIEDGAVVQLKAVEDVSRLTQAAKVLGINLQKTENENHLNGAESGLLK